MIDAEKRCLSSLCRYTSPNGEMCVPFKVLERDTGFDRATVRRHVRRLKRKGFAEFFSGLCTCEGEFAGSGYCITEAGIEIESEFPFCEKGCWK